MLGHITPTQYRAFEIDPRVLAGLVRMIGAVNVSETFFPESDPAPLTVQDVRSTTAYMLSHEGGERFPVGDYDLVALRFVCAGRHYSLLAVENYHTPGPVLVDGHITTRNQAITAWIGDADPEEDPDLYLILDEEL